MTTITTTKTSYTNFQYEDLCDEEEVNNTFRYEVDEVDFEEEAYDGRIAYRGGL